MADYPVDGTTYSTLSAAEAGLPATPTEVDTIICEITSADTTQVLINNDRSTYALTVQPSASNEHAGLWDTGKYRLAVETNLAIELQSDNTVIIGLQIENTRTGTANLRQGLAFGSGGNSKILKCIIRQSGVGTGNTDSYGISTFDNAQTDLVVANNVVYDFAGTGIDYRSGTSGSPNVAYNNTVIGCNNGFNAAGGYGIFKNNLVFNSTTNAYNNSGGGDMTNSTNNAADVAAASIFGGNSVDVSAYAGTDIFEDYTNDDYHLKAAGGTAVDLLKDDGADLDADSYYAVTEDFEGDSRHATTPSIGADEYIVGAALNNNRISSMHFQKPWEPTAMGS